VSESADSGHRAAFAKDLSMMPTTGWYFVTSFSILGMTAIGLDVLLRVHSLAAMVVRGFDPYWSIALCSMVHLSRDGSARTIATQLESAIRHRSLWHEYTTWTA